MLSRVWEGQLEKQILRFYWRFVQFWINFWNGIGKRKENKAVAAAEKAKKKKENAIFTFFEKIINKIGGVLVYKSVCL